MFMDAGFGVVLLLPLGLGFELEFKFECEFDETDAEFDAWFGTIGVIWGIPALQARFGAEFGFEFEDEEIAEADVAVDEMEALEKIVLRLVGAIEEGEISKDRLLSWRSSVEAEVGVALDRSSSTIEGSENLLMLKE